MKPLNQVALKAENVKTTTALAGEYHPNTQVATTITVGGKATDHSLSETT